ncbi:hypothetical protein GW17_00017585 [Ensete ventricosum]|nr:hypothetical protein GW17_00017585 [Ensete ventricosum]
MGARGFFVGIRGMCRLLGTSTGKLRTQVVTSCWSRLLIFGGVTTAQSLLRSSGVSCLSSSVAEPLTRLPIPTIVLVAFIVYLQ